MKHYSYLAEVIESDLYSIACEDGLATTFDCRVGLSVNGVQYVHATFYAVGQCVNPDGITCVAGSRAAAQAFADKVNARGVVDLAHWVAVEREAVDLEARWAGYAYEEAVERGGGFCAR